MYINNRQNYNSNGLYVRKIYISNKFKEAIFEYTGDLRYEGSGYEESPDEIVDTTFYESFITMRKKTISRSDGFMLSGELRSTLSRLLNCLKVVKFEG